MQIRTLSVSEVNQYIKRILTSDPILAHIHIEGEISNYSFHSSGHMYFTLKDDRGKINCVMFKSYCENLKFLPETGMSVVCRGQISLYERGGQYQLYVNTMEPAGIGELYIAYDQLKQRLEAEGLFHSRHKRPIPYIPKKIALITSPTGAAIRDIISIILRRFPRVDLYVFPVLVQGDKAPPDIVEAIRLCNTLTDIDVAIVGRGGGAIEELWAFNEEEVARAIFNSKIPIISAVGHETDFTIADFVADLRAATPSAAAELVVPNVLEVKEYINNVEKRLLGSISIKINKLQQRLALVENNYFFKNPLNPIYDKGQYIDNLMENLIRTLKTKKEFKEKYLLHIGDQLNALSPLSIFSRGYSIVRGEDDKVIKSVDEVEKDHLLNIELIDGKVNCKVIRPIKEERAFVRSQI